MSTNEEQKIKAQAVGLIPSGLFIVAAKDSKTDNIDGYLASWVQQVSFSPLRLSLAIRAGRPAYEMIKNKSVFTINVVGQHDKSFLKHFWSGYDPEKNPFSEIPWRETSDGGVQLTQALGSIDCKLVEMHSPGDHDLAIVEVLGSEILASENKPMFHVRKTGLDY